MLTKKLFLFAFVFLFLFSFASSLDGMGARKMGVEFNFCQPCSEATYITISSISLPNGSTTFLNTNMTFEGSGQFCYPITPILSGRHDIIGISDGCERTFATYFISTPSGDLVTVGNAIFYVGLLTVLIFFLAMSLTAFVKFDNLLSRVGMIGLSYLFLLGVVFISWNMASDFLTSAPFLIEFMRIIFFVLIISAFPLLIGGFVWYFLMLWKIKEIQRLMTKGFDFDEAEERVNNRRKRR